ncbi:hypothetical protein BP5796_08121 [Coleophoma crateriformis]|uniref:Uncharacterized protein n=1 Tax=Coleophoma crateriformis TaxID=565419 RepID=A0A3D8RDF8_9HELO|nr:hypothetical protein BP5796_08121 [Coleophoma crateriformis]
MATEPVRDPILDTEPFFANGELFDWNTLTWNEVADPQPAALPVTQTDTADNHYYNHGPPLMLSTTQDLPVGASPAVDYLTTAAPLFLLNEPYPDFHTDSHPDLLLQFDNDPAHYEVTASNPTSQPDATAHDDCKIAKEEGKGKAPKSKCFFCHKQRKDCIEKEAYGDKCERCVRRIFPRTKGDQVPQDILKRVRCIPQKVDKFQDAEIGPLPSSDGPSSDPWLLRITSSKEGRGLRVLKFPNPQDYKGDEVMDEFIKLQICHEAKPLRRCQGDDNINTAIDNSDLITGYCSVLNDLHRSWLTGKIRLFTPESFKERERIIVELVHFIALRLSSIFDIAMDKIGDALKLPSSKLSAEVMDCVGPCLFRLYRAFKLLTAASWHLGLDRSSLKVLCCQISAQSNHRMEHLENLALGTDPSNFLSKQDAIICPSLRQLKGKVYLEHEIVHRTPFSFDGSSEFLRLKLKKAMTENPNLDNPVGPEQYQGTERGGSRSQNYLAPILRAGTASHSSGSLQQTTDRTTESSFEDSCPLSDTHLYGRQATESQPTTVETGPNVPSDCQSSNSHHGKRASHQDELTEEQTLRQRDMKSTVQNDIQGIVLGDSLDPVGPSATRLSLDDRISTSGDQQNPSIVDSPQPPASPSRTETVTPNQLSDSVGCNFKESSPVGIGRSPPEDGRRSSTSTFRSIASMVNPRKRVNSNKSASSQSSSGSKCMPASPLQNYEVSPVDPLDTSRSTSGKKKKRRRRRFRKRPRTSHSPESAAAVPESQSTSSTHSSPAVVPDGTLPPALDRRAHRPDGWLIGFGYVFRIFAGGNGMD